MNWWFISLFLICQNSKGPFYFFSPFLVISVFLNQDIFPHRAAVAESFSEVS